LGVEQLAVPQMGFERESERKKEREYNKHPAHTLTQGERESANCYAASCVCVRERDT